ncbi:solute carrier family 32 (vesicular inhibitory amino acid transporter) [Entomortierella parvispora]|uniref:Solute carrier family 32 (Vesicular inhibitory amino acid transporter) n=1 Tax=Entomortierella parvispora TaxID=205924 RepID=A0A9P3HCS3_9FUNG|nr:solute carrier family 32 (vesicular inhibitory amino acid transporter) [Entomortierella parvispora]
MEKHPEEMYEVTSVNSDKESVAVDLLAERPEQGSNFLAYANVVCVVAGTGTLGLPYALRLGGWIGVGILILSLIMSVYTAILLMKCLYYNGKYRLSSYQEVGRHAFGKPGLIAVWFFHTSIVLGAPIMYLILSGTEMVGLAPSAGLNVKAWIWIAAAIVAVPFCSMKTLKEVAVMSVFGALATVVLVIVAVRGSIMDMSNPVWDKAGHDNIIWANLPTTVASISICFGGNVVYMHVEEAMRYPKSWNRVVAAALGTCSILYLATAIPGYLAYGNLAESPILSNLPQDLTTKIGTIVIIVHVILAAPILLTSFALEFERLCDITVARRGKVMERVYRTLVRLVIIGFCGGIACTVPFFGDFLSLLGALGNCTLIFVLPILCYFKLIGWRQMKWYELVWCAIIVIIGVLSAVIGSIDAIKALHEDFVTNN